MSPDDVLDELVPRDDRGRGLLLAVALNVGGALLLGELRRELLRSSDLPVPGPVPTALGTALLLLAIQRVRES